MSTSRRSTTAMPRRAISTGSLQQTPFIKLTVTTPPLSTGSLAEHIKHFTIGVLVLGICFFTCMHILMSMGIDYRSPSFLFTLPHLTNFSDTALGLPTCRHRLTSNGYGISALQRLSVMHGRDDVRLKRTDSIVQNLRFYYDSNDLRQPGQTTDMNSTSCTAVSRLIDAGVCISGAAAVSVNRLRGRTSNDGNTDKGVLRCLPSLIIAGTMKSGTGVLMRWLNTHPQLQSGVSEDGGNEIHFFTDNPATVSIKSQSSSGTSSSSISNSYTGSCDWQQYARRFPNFGLQSSSSDSKSSLSPSSLSSTASPSTSAPILLSRARQVYTFDKSPDYIRSPEKLRRLHEMLPSARLVVLLRDPVRRAVSGFSHNCRHGRYVRLDRTLSLSFLPHPTRYHLNGTIVGDKVNNIPFVAMNATTSTGSKSKTSAAATAAASSSSSSTSSSATTAAEFAASSSLSPLLWALLPAQFGIVPNPGTSPGQTTGAITRRPLSSSSGRSEMAVLQQHVRLPAGTVLQLRDLQALLALALPTTDYPSPSAARSGAGTGIATGYSVLRYPCSATDFKDYYFGTSRAYTPKSANNNRPTPLSGAASNNSSSSSSSVSSVVSTVSAFAAEEVAVGHYDTQLQQTYQFFPKEQVLVLFQEDMQRNILRTLRRVENFLGLPCHDFIQGVADVEIVPATARPTTVVHGNTVTNDTSVTAIITNKNSSIDMVDSASSLIVLMHHRNSGHGKTIAQVGWWLLMTIQAVVKTLVNGVLGLLGDNTRETKASAAISSPPPSISLTESFRSTSGPGGPGPGRSGSSSRHSARLQQQVLGDTLTLSPPTTAFVSATITKPNDKQAYESPPTLRTLLVALYQDHNRRLLEYTTTLPREWIEI